MAARQRELSAIGEFRRDFWCHVAGRHPGEVKPGHAGSNVYHPVEEANLRVAQYVARDHVGVYLVKSSLQDSERSSQIKPYVRPLRKALNNETMSEFGGTVLRADTQDRANWDRMADWLHDRRVIYERVLRWQGIVDRMPELLTKLRADGLRRRENLGDLPDRGVYVFYENDKPVYVGRTNKMRERIQQRGRESSGHNSASFAFLLAVDRAQEQGVNSRSRSREELEHDEQFSRWFSDAKEKVRQMQCRVVEVPDAIEQAVFEIYAALELGTTRPQGYNDFETH